MSVYSFIITGQKNAGKSSLCWKLLRYLNQKTVSVGGVITLQNDKKWFYLIAEDKKFVFEAGKGEPFIKVGRFRIHKVNLGLAFSSIKASLDREYLFIDEVGPLELDGEGYFSLIDIVLSRVNGNFLVVRESILEKFFERFPKASSYKLIKVENHKISSHFKFIKKHLNQ